MREREREGEKETDRQRARQRQTHYANDVRHSVSSPYLLATFGIEPQGHLNMRLVLLVWVVLRVLGQLLHIK